MDSTLKIVQSDRPYKITRLFGLRMIGHDFGVATLLQQIFIRPGPNELSYFRVQLVWTLHLWRNLSIKNGNIVKFLLLTFLADTSSHCTGVDEVDNCMELFQVLDHSNMI